MKIKFSLNGAVAEIDTDHPIDISVPLRFSGERLSVYGATPPTARAYTKSVADGGVVNCEIYDINPHCQGTHTECIGHITPDRRSVSSILKKTVMTAQLITVEPEQGAISKESMQEVFSCEALVIRTMPNDENKKWRDYDLSGAAYMTAEAMDKIRESGIRHILIDTPSVDPLQDGGRLLAHKAFWRDNEEGTITELIYIPDHVPDGLYILDLQIPAMDADAVPSRPLLYEVSYE